jgi:hypothetical protein
MINKQASIEALRDMETHHLITIIDTDYYRSMIACAPEQMNDTIDRLITELIEVQEGCAIADRFDLAIVCTSKLAQLAEQMSVREMLY